jgi:hypothetical protein
MNFVSTANDTPFDLDDAQAYGQWREQKLAQYPTSLYELQVSIADPFQLKPEERASILKACGRANMAVYQVAQCAGDMSDKAMVAALGKQFGLQRLDCNLYADDDGISALRVSREKRQFEYIPYSNRPISWHTDGYYNTLQNRIRAMILHCAVPARQGGENALLDHEMVYIQMRDENPAYIEALMQPDVMTIPANIEQGVEIRPAQTGPVFSVDEETGALHMRYTARTRSIEWKADKTTRAAVQFLEELLAADSPYVFRHRLAAGQGVICNNVLHTRTAFEDDGDSEQHRLMFRARYFDRIR